MTSRWLRVLPSSRAGWWSMIGATKTIGCLPGGSNRTSICHPHERQRPLYRYTVVENRPVPQNRSVLKDQQPDGVFAVVTEDLAKLVEYASSQRFGSGSRQLLDNPILTSDS